MQEHSWPRCEIALVAVAFLHITMALPMSNFTNLNLLQMQPGVVDDVNKLASGSRNLADDTARVADEVTRSLQEAEAEVETKKKELVKAEEDKNNEVRKIEIQVQEKKVQADNIVSLERNKLTNTKSTVSKYRTEMQLAIGTFSSTVGTIMDNLRTNVGNSFRADFMLADAMAGAQNLVQISSADIKEDVSAIARDTSALAESTKKVANAVISNIKDSKQKLAAQTAQKEETQKQQSEEIAKVVQDVQNTGNQAAAEVKSIQSKLTAGQMKVDQVEMEILQNLDNLRSNLVASLAQLKSDFEPGKAAALQQE